MKRMLSILPAIIAFLLLCSPRAMADVKSTEEPAAGQTIYIAGNPDMYPLEYYDEETDSYLGLMPSVFDRISENTGRKFTYIRSGKDNQQERMGKNLQADIISAHNTDEVKSVANKVPLFTYEDSKGSHTACIAFTNIASEALIRDVKAELGKIKREEYLQMAMQLSQKRGTSAALIVLLAFIALSLAAAIVIIYAKGKKKKAADRSQKMTDSLTGIGNKEFFEYGFRHYIPQEAQELYYTAYISINMKKVRQYFKEQHSEEIQRYAANILSTSCKEDEFASRIDDGVFAVIFMASDRKKSEQRCEEWVDRLNQYEHRMMNEYEVGFAAGVYPLGRGRLEPETAVFNARQGYLFAVGHKENVGFSDERILNWELTNKRLQQKLIDAVSDEEFELYLQFIVDTNTEEIRAAEALTRWHSPENGVLSPYYYVENLIDLGLIDRLDFWVMEKVCRVLESWKDTEFKNIHISCNFTRQTFAKTNFIDRFRDIIKKYDFDHSLMTLELTEDVLVDESVVIKHNTGMVRELGFLIALDDFGSGYTSFCDLCDYPIDLIKLDRKIILKSQNSRARELLKGISKVSHELGIYVLCEGVEKEEELDLAHYINSDLIQGFRFSHVLPFEEACVYFRKYQKNLSDKKLKTAKD